MKNFTITNGEACMLKESILNALADVFYRKGNHKVDVLMDMETREIICASGTDLQVRNRDGIHIFTADGSDFDFDGDIWTDSGNARLMNWWAPQYQLDTAERWLTGKVAETELEEALGLVDELYSETGDSYESAMKKVMQERIGGLYDAFAEYMDSYRHDVYYGMASDYLSEMDLSLEGLLSFCGIVVE